MLAERLEVVFVGFKLVDRVYQIIHHGVDIDAVALMGSVFFFLRYSHQTSDHAGHVYRFVLKCDRISRKRILLYAVDVCLYTGGYRKDQSHADDADGAGKAGHEGTSFFGHQVVERQRESSEEGHRGALFLALGFSGRAALLLDRLHGGAVIRCGVGGHTAIDQTNDTAGVLLGQLGIVRDHDDQTILGDLAEQIHDLNAGFGIQSTRRLVGKKDVGIVDQCTRDGDTLHLTAGHLIGLFVELISQSYLLQYLDSATASLGLSDAGECQCQLDVGKYRLMWDQIVALKNKADGMVAVGIPIAVAILLGGTAVNDQVAAGVLVKSADDVEKRGFSASGRAENRDKLVFPKLNVNAAERVYRGVANGILLCDSFQYQHIVHKDSFPDK